MERLGTCELRDKEVINMCDGTRLGCPTDFEFSICDGKITAIIVAGQGGFLGFGQCDDIIVPWNKIECIGEDTILVKLLPEECSPKCSDKRKKRKSTW